MKRHEFVHGLIAHMVNFDRWVCQELDLNSQEEAFEMSEREWVTWLNNFLMCYPVSEQDEKTDT